MATAPSSAYAISRNFVTIYFGGQVPSVKYNSWWLISLDLNYCALYVILLSLTTALTPIFLKIGT